MVQVVRTISNQIIIGNTEEKNGTYYVDKPYYIIPTEHGLQFYPMDAEILGNDLPLAEISKQNTLYCTTPGEQITDGYLRAIEGKGAPAIEQEVAQSIIT